MELCGPVQHALSAQTPHARRLQERADEGLRQEQHSAKRACGLEGVLHRHLDRAWDPTRARGLASRPRPPLGETCPPATRFLASSRNRPQRAASEGIFGPQPSCDRVSGYNTLGLQRRLAFRDLIGYGHARAHSSVLAWMGLHRCVCPPPQPNTDRAKNNKRI